jgi:hypothetical protein
VIKLTLQVGTVKLTVAIEAMALATLILILL